MRCHKICFHCDIRKIIFELSSIPPLIWSSGPGCSKPMTSLVNVSLKFQTLISQIRQYFLLKKCEWLENEMLQGLGGLMNWKG